MVNMITQIWNDRLHENIVWNFILKLWILGLMGLFTIGFVGILYGIISGEADIQNATFGIFDTLG